jgi:photosynthetic reaction center cytochrome c subunit
MILVRLIAFAVALGALAGCERTRTEQRGYRGLGMVQVDTAAQLRGKDDVNKVPKPFRTVSASGPTAAQEYQNVQVLGDLSKAEFARLMLSFKDWLAPAEGCAFCHNAPDYASDEKYTKVVARAMISMTRHINTDWKTHVKETGVTCYTCHRGQPVPPKVWFSSASNQVGSSIRKPVATLPTGSSKTTVLAFDPLTDFLVNDSAIRVIGPQPLAGANTRNIRDTRTSYSLMLVMADSLGVNCTFCHNSRAFAVWNQGPTQRETAWYGIRMARDLNSNYIVPLGGLLPASRFGPAGDSPKLYCATCHIGSNKPLNGVRHVEAFPELIASKADRAANAAIAASAPALTVAVPPMSAAPAAATGAGRS